MQEFERGALYIFGALPIMKYGDCSIASSRSLRILSFFFCYLDQWCLALFMREALTLHQGCLEVGV